MILRLIPPIPSQHTVTFAVSFKAKLPDSINIPSGWAVQLQKVLGEELETPTCLHALDKAAWGVSLLEEVTFNAALRIIHCVYVDGSRDSWRISDSKCLLMLHKVLQDVNTSCHAADQERESQRGKDVGFFPFSRPSSPSPAAAKPKTHKRSRSLLMSIVASFVPSSRPSSPVQQEFADVVPPKEEPEVDVNPNTDQRGFLKKSIELPRPRFLRRQARATLIDAFRLYILPHLSNPFTSGGYPSWAIRSALSRIETRMTEILECTGLDPATLIPPSPSASPSLISASPFDDDSGTDTDGSSLHTPQDSFSEPPFYYQPAMDGEDAFIDLESGLPRTPSPPKTPPMAITTMQSIPSDSPAAEYIRLYHSGGHLQAMFRRLSGVEEETAMESRTMLAVLEVKSRRRAWSNVALMGRSVADLSGLATPIRASPLARVPPTTPESLVADQLKRSRLSTISESSFPEDVYSDDEYPLHESPFYNSPILNCIPFPQTEDFCSTAPQDPLPLFATPESLEGLPRTYHADPLTNDLGSNTQSMCDEFTLALDLQSDARGHRRVGAKQLYERDGWISASPLIC